MPSAQGLKFFHGLVSNQKSTKLRSSKLEPLPLVVGFLTLFFGLLAVNLTWKVYSGYQNKLWDGKTRLTVVVAKENPEVFSLEPATGTLIKFTIPQNTQIESSKQLGKWFAGSLWKLGQQKGFQGELLRRSMQKSLGIPVDAWIEDGGEVLFSASSLGKFGALQKAIFTGTYKTNLTFLDRLNILGSISGNIGEKEISLTATRVLIKTKLTDGEEAFVVVPEQASITFEKHLKDDIVFAQTKTVSVLNTAGKQGIGAEVTRVAQVLGTRVIGARASDEKYRGVCMIRGEADSIFTLSAKRLASLYGCELEEKQPRGPASIEILLGEKFPEEY